MSSKAKLKLLSMCRDCMYQQVCGIWVEADIEETVRKWLKSEWCVVRGQKGDEPYSCNG